MRAASARSANAAITSSGTSLRPARSSSERPLAGSRRSRSSTNGCRSRGGCDGDEALGELALRYFRSHGPATAADLARWSGLTVGDVRRGIGICGAKLTTLELDGVTYHLGPETLDVAAPTARVHLLPGFDEYLLGYGDRTAALAREHSDAIVPGGNGMFKPTIVVDGEVVGTWRRTLRAGEIIIEAAPFARLPSTVHEGLAKAVEAYGAFTGRPARLARAGVS